MRTGQKHHDEWNGTSNPYAISPDEQYKRCTLQPVIDCDVRPQKIEPKSTFLISHDPATFERPQPQQADTKIHYEPSQKTPTRAVAFLPRNNIISPYQEGVTREERMRELEIRASKVQDSRQQMTCAEFLLLIRSIPDDIDKVKRAATICLTDYAQHGKEVLAEFKTKRARDMLAEQYDK